MPTFNGKTYGVGALLVFLALILTIVFIAVGKVELIPLGVVLLLIELGILLP